MPDIKESSWKRALAARYSRWLDLPQGIQVRNGWQGLVTELLDEISHMLGGETGCPELRVTEVRTELGRLVIGFARLPEERQAAIARVVEKAAYRSAMTCEWCGEAGDAKLSERHDLVTACDAHG